MCTGETVRQYSLYNVIEVYPHVYGGNGHEGGYQRCQQGLSPCVRGKPLAFGAKGRGLRSIPMCTGETPAMA